MIKTLFISVLLILVMITSHAQDLKRKYFTQDNKETKDSTNAFYYQDIENYTSIVNPVIVIQKFCGTNKTKLFGTYNNIIERKFIGQKIKAYENGKIKAKEKFSEDAVLIDTAQYYHPNGKLKIAYHYPYEVKNGKTIVTDTLILIFKDSLGKTHLVNGDGYAELYIEDEAIGKKPHLIEKGQFKNHKKTGKWTGSFLTNKYTFVEQYNNGKITTGVSKDSLNNEFPYDENNFETPPNPPGGINAFRQYIGNNFNYPQRAINARISGELRLSFVIEKDGSIANIKVEKDLGYDTGKEGIKLLKRSKKWSPGIQRGIPVRVQYMLPIRINLSQI